MNTLLADSLTLEPQVAAHARRYVQATISRGRIAHIAYVLGSR